MQRKLCWWALTPMLLAPAMTFAEEAASGKSSAIEEVVVTGSLIKRDNFDSAAPLKVIDQADIASQATPNLGEVLVNQTFNYGSDFQTNTYAARGQGGVTTAANLRGLGANATLTLIDGKRTFYQNLNNFLPQVAIERIDVLKDGGSALYGTDAVAGVVNIIPRNNFEGFQTSVFYQEADDLDETVFDFIMGSAMDRGHFMLAGSYKTRGQLQQTDRPKFLRQGFERSGTGNPGDWLVPNRDATGALTGTGTRTVDPGCGTYDGPGGRDVGSKNNWQSGDRSGGNCRLHFGEWWNYMNPQDQYSVYTDVRYDFSDNVSNELQMIYSYISTESRGSAQNPGGRTEELPIVLGDHPGNPFTAYSDLNGNGLVDDGERLYAQDANGDGVPDRGTDDVNGDGVPDVILSADPFNPSSGIGFNEDVDVLALRIFGKLGTLPTSFNDDGSNSGNATFDTSDFWFQDTLTWSIPNTSWEVMAHGGYEFTRTTFEQKNTSQNALTLGLQGQLKTNPTATTTEYWNPFSTQQLTCVDRVCSETGNPTFSNTLDVVNAVNIQAQDVNEYTQYIYSLMATGDVWELPAGMIGAAFGIEYRNQDWDIDLNAPYNECDWHEGGCGFDYKANQDSTEVFGEVIVPVLDSDDWGNIELQLAGRYVDYGGEIGDEFTPKVATRWQIRDWVAIRGSYSEAFIAPTILQQYSPEDCGLQTASDPLINDLSQSFRVACVKGNLQLSPETADVWSIGISFDLLDGDLNFGADWSEYKFKDRIVTSSLNQVINSDYQNYLASGNTPGDQAQIDAWVNGPDSSPDIFRDTAGGSNTISRVITARSNASEMTHKALDLYARYTLPWQDWGVFNLNIEATYVDEYSYDLGLPFTTPGDAAGSQNEQLIDIPPIPEWRVVSRLNWSYSNWAAMVRARWIDEFDLSFNSGALQGAQIAINGTDKLDSITYVDVNASYAFQGLLGEGRETTIEVGGNNIFDEFPDPIFNLGGIESFVHDIRGRMWYLRLTTDI